MEEDIICSVFFSPSRTFFKQTYGICIFIFFLHVFCMYVTCMRDFMYGLGKRLDLINDDVDDGC